MAHRVFISYRRSDHRALAQWLKDLLSVEIGGDEIFLDVDEIDPGQPFPERISDALRSSVVFVIMMGKGWEGKDPQNANAARRLDNPNDFVRKEVASALEYARLDPRKLVLPVLYDGLLMLSADSLPEDLRPLNSIHALVLPSDRPFRESLLEAVQAVVRHIDGHEHVPEEERWVLRQIANQIEGMDRHRIRRIAHELRRHFPSIGEPPESARALAAAIYRLGPAALECLLLFGRSGEDFNRLLNLLATHWINAETAGSLRGVIVHSPIGKGLAIRCEYSDFTPKESLLKASHRPSGWPEVTVKASDPSEEVVQQVHEALLERLTHRIRVPEPTSSSLDSNSRRKEEREKICDELNRRIASKGRALPFVLRLEHRTALDRTLIRALRNAFPPLHLLIATADPAELKQATNISAIFLPSKLPSAEREAFDAYADAQEILDDHQLDRI